MPVYKKLTQTEADLWNDKLRQTNASYFQYPYYGAGNTELPKSSVSYYELYNNETLIGFTSILNVKVATVKIGLIIRGPVILDNESQQAVCDALNKIRQKEGYFFLRINPNNHNADFCAILEKHPKIFKDDLFPIYKGSQAHDYIIENLQTEEEIVQYYKPRARQNLRYGAEEDFEISVSSSQEDMKKVYEVFRKVAEKKEFVFRSVKSYSQILQHGEKYNLAKLYIASKNNEIVNALFIVKDGYSFTYFSGALIEGDYRPRNSPATLLHHKVILDCLLNEKKQYYNISFTDPSHPVHTFKSSFNPVKINFPGYYTFVGNKLTAKLFYLMLMKFGPRLRKLLKRKYGNK